MFFPNSRYASTGTYTVKRADGRIVTVAIEPLPLPNPPVGLHRRLDGQRLDLIAANYLSDPTTFWRLCDANNSVVPDALGARALVGIPLADS
jgi:hypothetical protein